jgi:hypothetical protein
VKIPLTCEVKRVQKNIILVTEVLCQIAKKAIGHISFFEIVLLEKVVVVSNQKSSDLFQNLVKNVIPPVLR